MVLSAAPRVVVPDFELLQKTSQLCQLPEPYSFKPEFENLFVEAMAENMEWHLTRNAEYAAIIHRSGFTPQKLRAEKKLEQVPFLPASLFKERELLSIPREQVNVHLTSSGTTGQKSQVFFDDWSLGTAQEMVDRIFEFYGFEDHSKPVNYLMFTYEPKENLKLGTAYTDNFLCKYAPKKEVFYALRNDGNEGHEFDLFGTIDTLKRFEAENIPVRIFGFPAFLNFALERMAKTDQRTLKLHPESMTFFGGGWKGHANKAIGKPEFYACIEKYLGIPNERIRDGFGSTEHCIPYVECPQHELHVPVWSRVFVRNVRTLLPCDYGEQGFLQLMSPYITSMPANNVLMTDLASLHKAIECPCGLAMPFFRIYGRAGISKNRSCAAAALEVLENRS